MPIFDSLLAKKSDKYFANFPESNYNDRINEVVWWVKSKVFSQEHIYNFLISNVKNSHKLLVKKNLVSFNRENYFNWLLKNPGLMCEYFLVDYLSRNSSKYEIYKNKRFKFLHKKWTPEQDEMLKIDFLTTLTAANKAWKYSSINFWVQLTTSKSKAEYSKKRLNWLDWIGTKKWAIYRTSRMIDSWEIDNYSSIYNPHTMCLMVINSNINEFINVENINIFSNAFNTWKNEWFLAWGPTQYLNDLVKNDLEKINDWYHLWLEIFYKLLPKVLQNNRDFKSIKKYDNFDIIFDYNADKKELKMDYFLNDWSFLMSLFFIINDKLVKKAC